MKHIRPNLIGKVFGRLTVTSDQGSHWKCKCECGNERLAKTRTLLIGETRSCGCIRRDNCKTMAFKHGMSHTKEYRCWKGIKWRCRRKTHQMYPLYGGRGILVCDRWFNSFEAFYNDMGPSTSKCHSIERKDNNGHYEPSNCIWATKREQACNRRSTIFVKWLGQEIAVPELARKLGIKGRLIQTRLKRGLSLEIAISTPNRIHKYR